MSKADFFADDEFLDGYDTDTGKPGVMTAANAIQFWTMQNHSAETGAPSIRDIALAFKMPDEAVRTAIEWHPWMLVVGPNDDPTKQTIEHEGE